MEGVNYWLGVGGVNCWLGMDGMAGCGWGELSGGYEWLQFLPGCGWIGDGVSPISGMKTGL